MRPIYVVLLIATLLVFIRGEASVTCSESDGIFEVVNDVTDKFDICLVDQTADFCAAELVKSCFKANKELRRVFNCNIASENRPICVEFSSSLLRCDNLRIGESLCSQSTVVSLYDNDSTEYQDDGLSRGMMIFLIVLGGMMAVVVNTCCLICCRRRNEHDFDEYQLADPLLAGVKQSYQEYYEKVITAIDELPGENSVEFDFMCVICLDDEWDPSDAESRLKNPIVAMPKCGHLYHRECIRHMCVVKKNEQHTDECVCPLCRHPILPNSQEPKDLEEE